MKKIERIKMVKAMEFIARQVNDENEFETWLYSGVADGDIRLGDLDVSDEDEEYLSFYLDDENLAQLMSTFLCVMKGAAKSGGLYLDGVVSREFPSGMAVYLYDGTSLTCRTVECSHDGKMLILDKCRSIPQSNVLRIRPCEIDNDPDDDV